MQKILPEPLISTRWLRGEYCSPPACLSSPAALQGVCLVLGFLLNGETKGRISFDATRGWSFPNPLSIGTAGYWLHKSIASCCVAIPYQCLTNKRSLVGVAYPQSPLSCLSFSSSLWSFSGKSSYVSWSPVLPIPRRTRSMCVFRCTVSRYTSLSFDTRFRN